jgi:Spy/CpxP family protein refolding chaperone
MKTVKILLASLLISASAFSQTTKTPEERAKHQTEKMKNELGLTADQEQKVYTINLGIDQKNEGVKTSTMTEEEKKKSLKYNNQARETMLKEVLTADQFTKFQALKQEKVEMKKANTPNMNKINVQPTKEVKSNN